MCNLDRSSVFINVRKEFYLARNINSTKKRKSYFRIPVNNSTSRSFPVISFPAISHTFLQYGQYLPRYGT